MLKLEEILKQMLSEIKDIKRDQLNISDKLEAYNNSNKAEFKQLNTKINGMTDALAKVMEDITDLKSKVEKQDVEIRVIKGGK